MNVYKCTSNSRIFYNSTQLHGLSHPQLNRPNTQPLASGDNQSSDELKGQKKDEVKTVSISENEFPPKTGHAVLGEGSIDCIALSRKGLITAGKVQQVTTSSSLVVTINTFTCKRTCVFLSHTVYMYRHCNACQLAHIKFKHLFNG